MKSKINLLKKAQTPQFLREKTKKTVTLVTLASVVVFGVVFVSVLLLNLFLTAKIKAVNQKIRLKETKISTLAEVETIYWMISDRLVILGKILAQDKKFDEKLQKIGGVVPLEVSISQIMLTEGAFSLSVTSPRLSSLNQLIENLISPELGGKHFTKLVLEGLGLDEKGMYNLSLSGEIL